MLQLNHLNDETEENVLKKIVMVSYYSST